jgi:hypothetical protein
MLIVSFTKGTEYAAEVTFDENKQERMLDLRPELPLIVRW